ncbi:uncharacterized protein LOC131330845 [Rhododendron vialii]|uniref:uncharacterized protein LOC131330845 n=1 Tax=Rhododendron vialii TaxID=182163 RepID=UPI00265F0DD2|nr:uncharacterized protein LOC131330845 [Rhododendron vialii]
MGPPSSSRTINYLSSTATIAVIRHGCVFARGFIDFREEIKAHTLAEDVWRLYFDGAANQKGFGISVLLIALDGSHIPLAFRLKFEVTNNQPEYKACIVGMEAAIEIDIEKLEVVGDSNLVVSQANGDWKFKEEKLKPFY